MNTFSTKHFCRCFSDKRNKNILTNHVMIHVNEMYVMFSNQVDSPLDLFINFKIEVNTSVKLILVSVDSSHCVGIAMLWDHSMLIIGGVFP